MVDTLPALWQPPNSSTILEPAPRWRERSSAVTRPNERRRRDPATSVGTVPLASDAGLNRAHGAATAADMARRKTGGRRMGGRFSSMQNGVWKGEDGERYGVRASTSTQYY